MSDPNNNEFLLQCVADIVSAFVVKNKVVPSDVPTIIESVADTLIQIRNREASVKQSNLEPAVAVGKSVTPEHIVCLEDGKKFKSLKRHLRTEYDLSPEQYREKWQLPFDYPMVAPNYSKTRSDLAKKFNLGRKKKD